MSSFNAEIIAEFRANAGKVGGHWEGRDLLLLTTIRHLETRRARGKVVVTVA